MKWPSVLRPAVTLRMFEKGLSSVDCFATEWSAGVPQSPVSCYAAARSAAIIAPKCPEHQNDPVEVFTVQALSGMWSNLLASCGCIFWCCAISFFVWPYLSVTRGWTESHIKGKPQKKKSLTPNEMWRCCLPNVFFLPKRAGKGSRRGDLTKKWHGARVGTAARTHELPISSLSPFISLSLSHSLSLLPSEWLFFLFLWIVLLPLS